MIKKYLVAILLTVLSSFPANATGKLKVIASFSIVGDMVKNVAADNIELKTLVGANGDTHEFQPTPADATAIAHADLIIINGLGLEGWMERLLKSSGFKGKVAVASNGIVPLRNDPHAWQDVANGKIYVANIRDALIAADSSHADDYNKNTAAYIKNLDELDIWIKNEFGKIPVEKRKVISTHDAFKYFAKAYNVEFLAPQGLSTEAQASAADIARLIDQIRSRKITAIFFENMTDSRLMKQLEKDAGAHIGGTLYSDALSTENEPAPDYIDMFRHNVQELVKAMGYNGEK